MAYPENKYSVFGAAMDFPEYQSVTGTTLLAKNQDGNWGYISASNLQTTLDGAGLATDAAVTSLSGSIALAGGGSINLASIDNHQIFPCYPIALQNITGSVIVLE